MYVKPKKKLKKLIDVYKIVIKDYSYQIEGPNLPPKNLTIATVRKICIKSRKLKKPTIIHTKGLSYTQVRQINMEFQRIGKISTKLYKIMSDNIPINNFNEYKILVGV